MERIGSIVDKIIQQLEAKKRQNPALILKKFLTRQELRHIKLCNIRRQVATFNVDSSAWLYAFSLKKQELIAGLGVKDIRLRLGEVD
ncbi:MAG: hypothetical protein NC914_00560 [Candidatus Omnitrophica bacterium]|nr:hypothetical protein [Candidatus Omnitrophota bacterium]